MDGKREYQSRMDQEAQKQGSNSWLKDLPNKLTLFRVLLIPVICLLYPWDMEFLNYFCAFLFAVGAITDFLDGYIARKMNSVTKIGEIFDPISDKLLVAAAVVILTDAGILSGWITVLILSRELAISGLRLAAVEQGFSIKVSSFGKIKTALQDIALVLLLCKVPQYATIGMLVLWVSIGFSYYSAYQYWTKFWAEARRQNI